MLSESHIDLLLDALKTNELDFAITALGLLPASRNYADAARLLERCKSRSRIDRERLRVLLTDLIARYPNVIWSTPVLLHAQTPEIALLTLPDIESGDVSGNAISARWMPINQVRVMDPSPRREILTNRTGCALLTVQTVGSAPLEVDDNLLARIFTGVPLRGTLRWGIGPVLPHPESIEAGFLMSAIVHRKDQSGLPATPRYFLQDDGWESAVNTGLIFREREPTTHRNVSS